MPFRYRLQKILDFRIRKKEEQLQNVRKAQATVLKIEGLIERNNQEIATTRVNMRKADFMQYEAYDNFLKHLYVKGENLEVDRIKAQEVLEEQVEEKLEEISNVVEEKNEEVADSLKNTQENVQQKLEENII